MKIAASVVYDHYKFAMKRTKYLDLLFFFNLRTEPSCMYKINLAKIISVLLLLVLNHRGSPAIFYMPSFSKSYK